MIYPSPTLYPGATDAYPSFDSDPALVRTWLADTDATWPEHLGENWTSDA